MPVRKVDQWEKDWIRQELAEATARSATEQQIQEMIEELADVIGLTVKQVSKIASTDTAKKAEESKKKHAQFEMTERQKFIVRDRTITAIANKQDEPALHHALASQFSDELQEHITVRQIAATAAHVRIKADKVLKENELYEKIDRDTLIRAWNAVSETDNPETLPQVAQQLSMTVEQLKKLFDAYEELLGMERERENTDKEVITEGSNGDKTVNVVHKIDKNRDRIINELNEGASNEPHIFEDANEMDDKKSKKISTLDPEDQESKKAPEIIVNPNSGAWADFEGSEIKDKWRQLEAQFIDAHIDPNPEVRARMKILCTPGIKCYKEVDRLLALGFKSENITAIERVKGAWADFEWNCRQKGICPIYGDLKKILPEMQEKFDIACIDFLGPFCDSYVDILQQLPLRDRGIVAINMMAKRERKSSQEKMNAIQDIVDKKIDEYRREMRTEAERRAIEKGVAHIPGMIDVEVEMMAITERKMGDRHVSETRDKSLVWLLPRVGTAREDNWMFAKRLKNLEPHFMYDFIDPNITSHYQKIRKTVDEAMKKFALMLELILIRTAVFSTITPEQHPRITRGAIISALFGDRWVGDLKQYRYQSGVSKSHSPFITNLAVLEKSTDVYESMRKLLHFGLLFVEALDVLQRKYKKDLIEDRENPFLLGRIKKDTPILSLPSFSRNITGHDHIQIIKRKKSIGDIALKELVFLTKGFTHLAENKYPLHSSDKSLNFESVERETITLDE